MKFLTAVILIVAGCNGQGVLDRINSEDNVFFTGYNAPLETDNLQFTPANPKKHTTDEGGDLDTTVLVYTQERERIQYWGMEASYEAKKVWANNVRSSQLKQFDLDTGDVTTVARDLTSGLENLAYDRITKVLYWTDSTDKVIRAIELTFRHFTEVYRSEVAPYALTVHPVKRKLFFSVYKTDNNFISDTELIKCDLDGGNQRAILRFPDVIRPRGITIDFSSDLLFWTDQNFLRQATIMACDLNGRRRKQFFAKSQSFLWGIAHYKGYVYATDIVNTTDNKYEIEIRKTTGRESYTRQLDTRPRNVAIYAPDETATTKVTNECHDSKCEHICLARDAGGFVCKCSPGFTLVSGYKCVSDSLTDDYILVADLGQKRLFQLPIRKSTRNVGDLVAIDLDDVTDDRIYAASVIKKTGGLAWFDISAREIVWGSKRLSRDDAVLSITTGCCNKKVYWTTQTGIYSWDGVSSTPDKLYSVSFFSDAQIRQVVVDCKANLLYWIEYDSFYQNANVKRSNLKGRDVETVLRSVPNSFSLTIDYESYTLHVLTALEGVVYSIPLKGLEKSVPSTSPNHAGYTRTKLKPHIKSNVFLLLGIVVVDGYAYVTDDINDVIMRFNLKRGASSLEHYGGNQVFFPSAIDFYSESYYTKYLRPICEARIGSRLPPPTTTTPAPTTTAGSYCSRQYYKDISEGVNKNIAFSLYISCFNTFNNLIFF